MLLSPIDPIILKTAESFPLPKDLVRRVIMHQFKVVDDNYKYWRFVGFRFEDLGSFVIRPAAFERAFKQLLQKARKNPTSNYKFTVGNAFKLRHQITDYHNSKKYKERFGSWHH